MIERKDIAVGMIFYHSIGKNLLWVVKKIKPPRCVFDGPLLICQTLHGTVRKEFPTRIIAHSCSIAPKLTVEQWTKAARFTGHKSVRDYRCWLLRLKIGNE